jgi:S23 ribosomal protein.
MSSKTFECLRVWHDARQLTRSIYTLTSERAFSRDLGLRDQLRRAAISIMSNIAEGYERGGSTEFRRFLRIAKGSCGELRSQLYAAEDVGYIRTDSASELRTITAQLCRRIDALMKRLV